MSKKPNDTAAKEEKQPGSTEQHPSGKAPAGETGPGLEKSGETINAKTPEPTVKAGEIDLDSEAGKAANEAAHQRHNMIKEARLFNIDENLSDDDLHNKIAMAHRTLDTTAKRLGMKYDGDGSFESVAQFIADVNREAAKGEPDGTRPRTYIAQWNLQHDGVLYVEGDHVKLTDAQVAKLVPGVVLLK
jgi:hypothetical protein